jgi:hypothetical protein
MEGSSRFAEFGLKKGSQGVEGFGCVRAFRGDEDFASVRADQGHKIENAFTVNGIVGPGDEYFRFKLVGDSNYLGRNSRVDPQSVGDYEFLHNDGNFCGVLLQSDFLSIKKISGVY